MVSILQHEMRLIVAGSQCKQYAAEQFVKQQSICACTASLGIVSNLPFNACSVVACAMVGLQQPRNLPVSAQVMT
jgi:hypothetical protein